MSYTYKFYERDVSFDEFVWISAKRFSGFSISEKGKPSSKDEFEALYRKNLKKCEDKLKLYQNILPEKLAKVFKKERALAIKISKDEIKNKYKLRKRMEKVLAQINNWIPDEPHKTFHNSLIRDISEEIKYGCDISFEENYIKNYSQTPEDWLKDQIEIIEKDIIFYQTQLKDHRKIFEDQRQFIHSLKKIIPFTKKINLNA